MPRTDKLQEGREQGAGAGSRRPPAATAPPRALALSLEPKISSTAPGQEKSPRTPNGKTRGSKATIRAHSDSMVAVQSLLVDARQRLQSISPVLDRAANSAPRGGSARLSLAIYPLPIGCGCNRMEVYLPTVPLG